ncbi:MAG TPA: hypothetical protein VFB16_04870 [Bauldia sp.]|nr:hypothetical protein [Bauldia sp.]
MAPPMNAPMKADAGNDIDWRWGFEPEAWISLRSRRALAAKPSPQAIRTEPSAPARRYLLPRLAAVMRNLFAG